MNIKPFIRAILNQYKLDPDGLHGLPHWERVHNTGVRLAESTGADTTVIKLFAVFHDACRISEFKNSEHGVRGAALAAKLRGEVFNCSDVQIDLVVRACSGLTHSPHGEKDMTNLTCWNADRLDLGRVGK